MTIKEKFEELINEKNKLKAESEEKKGAEKIPYVKKITLLGRQATALYEVFSANIDNGRCMEIAKSVLSEAEYKSCERKIKQYFESYLPDKYREEPNVIDMLNKKDYKGIIDYYKVLLQANPELADSEEKDESVIPCIFSVIGDESKIKLSGAYENLLEPGIVEETLRNASEVKYFAEMKDDELTYVYGENNLNEMADETQDKLLKEDIAYIKKNIKTVKHELDSGFSAEILGVQFYMPEQLSVNAEKESVNYPELNGYREGGLMANELTEGKENGLLKLKEMKYDLGEDSKKAMLTIMKKIDEMGLVDESNMLVAEEGTKKYAFAFIYDDVEDIRKCIDLKDTAKLHEATEKYKKDKKNMDALLTLAKENFSTDGLSYGCNVDIARTKEFPPEYRKEAQAVSQISSLFLAVKVCKYAGIKFEDFCADPQKATFDLIDRFTKDVSVNNLMSMHQNAGEKIAALTKSSNPELIKFSILWGLTMRAVDSVYGMDKRPETVIHNSFINKKMEDEISRINHEGMIAKDLFKFEAEATFENIFIADEKDLDFSKMCASPMVTYDFNKDKPIEKFDADSYMKNKDYDLIKQAKYIRETINSYLTERMVADETFFKMVKGAANASDKILAGCSPEKEGYAEMKELSDSLKDKQHIKDIIKGATAKVFKANREYLERVCGTAPDKDELLKKLGKNALIISKDTFRKIKGDFINSLYTKALIINNYDVKKADYNKIYKSVSDYITSLTGFKTAGSTVDNNNPPKDITTLTDFRLKDAYYDAEVNSNKALPLTYGEGLSKCLAASADGSKDRIGARGKFACDAAEKMWQNASNEGEKEIAAKQTVLLLKQLEDKHATRSGLWRFFHYFGDNAKEKKYISDLKSLLTSKDVTEEQIESYRQSGETPVPVNVNDEIISGMNREKRDMFFAEKNFNKDIERDMENTVSAESAPEKDDINIQIEIRKSGTDLKK